jgi:hypothetical protein
MPRASSAPTQRLASSRCNGPRARSNSDCGNCMCASTSSGTLSSIQFGPSRSLITGLKPIACRSTISCTWPASRSPASKRIKSAWQNERGLWWA